MYTYNLTTSTVYLYHVHISADFTKREVICLTSKLEFTLQKTYFCNGENIKPTMTPCRVKRYSESLPQNLYWKRNKNQMIREKWFLFVGVELTGISGEVTCEQSPAINGLSLCYPSVSVTFCHLTNTRKFRQVSTILGELVSEKLFFKFKMLSRYGFMCVTFLLICIYHSAECWKWI